MMKKFNNLFEVNGNDNLGTAVLKGAVKGYIQGTLAAGLGLGILGIGIMIASKKEESEEEDEIEFELDDELVTN